MPTTLNIISFFVLVAVCTFHAFVTPLLTQTLGIGRKVQPLAAFPQYSCRKIIHPLLEGCEDLWLDEVDRKIYAACADPETRTAYQPTVSRLNVSGRTGQDRFVVIDIDNPGPKQDFGPLRLTTKGYVGALPGKPEELDLHGFDVEATGQPTLRFYAVNHRPPVDAETGAVLNTTEVGLNSTVEVFDLVRGATELTWVRTYSQPDAVKTPNRVAVTGEGGFVATNDHGEKVGRRRTLEAVLALGRGSLAFCDGGSSCHIATKESMRQPNGLVRSKRDGLFYVPSSADGNIRAYLLSPPGTEPRTLKEVASISITMPMDNLAVDANGIIWAAAFPKVSQLLEGFDNPRTATPPATVWRIERDVVRERFLGDGKDEYRDEADVPRYGYQSEKVLEDAEGTIIGGSTTVLNDAKTGRLFFGGVFMPHMAVCERN